ncbi:MAG: polysaccharide biosynthesis tyrosine autokinase [Terracidiphilus sp.]
MTGTVTDFAPEVGENKTLVFSDIARMFKKYLWLLIVLSLTCSSIAYVWTKRQPKQYDATAMLQIDQHGTLSLGSTTISDDYELKINTEMLAVQSRDVAMDVIERLGLQNNKLFNPMAPRYTNLKDPATRNYLAGVFAGGLMVERIPKSELISITYRSLSPALSSEVANTIVDAYMEQNFQNHFRGSKEITGWLTKELGDLKSRVQDEQAELLGLESKLGVYSTNATSETSLFESELEELLADSIRTQTQRFIAEAQYKEFTSDTTGAMPPQTMPGAQVIGVLSTQLAALQAQQAALTQRYGPGYAPLKQIDSQVENLQSSLADERRKVAEGAREEVDAATKTEAEIQAKIDALKAQAKAMSPEAVHYQVLKAQYMADQTLYNGLLGLLSAGGIEAGLKTQDVNRMSTADIPSTPSQPRVMVSTIMGFGIGFLLAATIIFVLAVVSDTVETVEQIEESLGLPVLAAVPVYKLDTVDPSSQVMPLISLNYPRSAGAEAYRILRTSVSLIPVSRQSRVIGITSCGPGEGKSTTIMNLGVVFSQQNKRVLLIDADMRKPNLSHWMKMSASNAPGLSRFLSDPSIKPDDCIEEISTLPGMSMISVGAIPPFPSELLGQGRFEELIAWARLNFDVVLIDTPPALLVTDAFIVTQSLDILLLVARVGVAQRRALRRLRKELARFPDKHVGMVVNVVPQSQSYYSGYGGKYGYYRADDK